jgi:pantoate--beta-alanine ligase
MTALVHTTDELRKATVSHEVGVIMTMGALHDGHAELVRVMRREMPEGFIVLTDYVNPTQFGAGEDFDQYPRTLEHDVAVATAAGADVVFAPTTQEVYGSGGAVATLDSGPLGIILEGAARPGHFNGMLTVVARLMDLTHCVKAAFGEKDYQQLVLVERMAARRTPPVAILRVPTVREPDGLAMSSRNRYLSSQDRAAAASIPRALAAAAGAVKQGGDAAIQAGVAELDPRLVLEYLVVRDPELGDPVPGPGRILIAVQVGRTRLIDNIACEVGA